jgi:hypothetical protein
MNLKNFKFLKTLIIRFIYSAPIPLLRILFWRIYQQKFEFNFQKGIGRIWRESNDFMLQTKKLFSFWGYSFNQFNGKTIIDIGAGSKLRSKFFIGSKIFAVEPLANKFKRLKFSDIFDADNVYCVSAEKYIPELHNKADLIICINVLDHVMNPSKLLANCFSYLLDSGEMLLSTDLHQEVSPSHPIGFTMISLEKIINEIGFVIKYRFIDKGYQGNKVKSITYKLGK